MVAIKLKINGIKIAACHIEGSMKAGYLDCIVIGNKNLLNAQVQIEFLPY